ncbi:lysophospholipid acyltransferase family protein [Candidatus Anaplasma sp. TIGMIC]|uniref:lysophospholipid acyltransferase family protein n=1 Tax=Candidatus Anaplasma sp. TIGMIC TaxID=3020713 RepID=UPI002330CFFD|nr:lysophospholipid acyltransferase family protein [Candidatus Anaplasma sp. TIGMIC]MDB1135685.1 lysophospholipid acyltransferase family protein [Candidatus Anaplasma sp. TIGMIC]
MLFYVASALFSIFYSLLMLPILVCMPFSVKNVATAFAGRCLLFFSKVFDGVTYEVIGKENVPEGPCVIAAEHKSPFETLILYVEFRNSIYVMKKELRTFPLLNLWWMMIGTVFIDRKSGISAMRKLLRECDAHVKKGRKVLMFPEGTRVSGKDAEAREYASGVAAIYQKLEIPVVPIVLNTDEYWPRNTVSFSKKKGKALLKVMPPIEQGLSKVEFMQSFKERILEGKKSLGFK